MHPSAVAVSPLPIVKAVPGAILLDDGEYVGSATEFFEQATLKLNIYREVGKQLTAVKYGSGAEMAAVWSKFGEINPGRHDPRHLLGSDRDAERAARNLLQERLAKDDFLQKTAEETEIK